MELLLKELRAEFNISLVVKRLKIRIAPYSAIKISANPVEAYSILNPETSSDSPSEKSKGVRLVSAIIDTSHKMPTLGIRAVKITLLLI